MNNLLKADVGVNMLQYQKDMSYYEELKLDLKDAKIAFPTQSGLFRPDHEAVQSIQNEMNKIEHKWTAPQRNEFYTTRKRINLLIERYNSSLNNLNALKSKIK